MQLSELTWACARYAEHTTYDESYRDLLDVTGPYPDLAIAEHRLALLRWLNRWGCRQFRPSQYDLASAELAAWWEGCVLMLPNASRRLEEMNAMEIAVLGAAYGWLQEREASTRANHSTPYPVSIGPTGAGKILFALRPHAALPWDAPIRSALNHDGGFVSYTTYLTNAQAMLLDLTPQCEALGFTLSELPVRVGRPGSSLPKLVDEYRWVTITLGESPTEDELAEWRQRLSH